MIMPPRLPDSVERWPIDRLLPYVANARSHPEAQVAQIAGSIAEFGFNVPCLVDERGVLIAGHGRLLAAKRLGLAGSPLRINRSALASVVSGPSVTSGTISIDAIGSSR